MNNSFPNAWKQGLYESIYRRRDMRNFLPDEIPEEIVSRLLHAAHRAPSVGFMQPWNFILIKDFATRRRIHDHVEQERKMAGQKFDSDRVEKYFALKLQGILDCPLNVCVTSDPDRFGPQIIGRNTIPETDIFSTCCAVQNFWLAARAEGVGVGWVSIFRPEEIRSILEIPREVQVIAYLCVGYVDSFPERPTLEEANWLSRVPLKDLVYSERWGKLAESAVTKVGELP